MSAVLYSNIHTQNWGQELARACDGGKVDEAKKVLQKVQAEVVNQKDSEGKTHLHTAAEKGDPAVVSLLLDSGADPTIKRNDGHTPFYVACSYGHRDVAELLIAKGANVGEALTDQAWTALHVAAFQGNTAVVSLLLDSGADSNVRSKGGITPLHLACDKGHKEVAELLIAKNAKIEEEDLPIAIKNGHVSVVILLLDNGASAKTKDGFTPLYLACRYGKKAIAELLIARGVSMDEKNGKDEWSALDTAICEKYTEIVSLLLDNGANCTSPGKDGFTPLYVACQLGLTEIVRLLIGKGVNLEEKHGEEEWIALAVAAEAGRNDVATLLLDSGANCDAKSKDGTTALFAACANNHKTTVTLLISRGANCKARSQNNLTPLYIACQAGHEEIAKLLIASGAKIEEKNWGDERALHVAAVKGYIHVVRMLLERGADPAALTKRNSTAEYLAETKGHKEIAKLLREKRQELFVQQLVQFVKQAPSRVFASIRNVFQSPKPAASSSSAKQMAGAVATGHALQTASKEHIAKLFENHPLDKAYKPRDFKKFEAAYNLLKQGRRVDRVTEAEIFTIVYKLAASKSKLEREKVMTGIQALKAEERCMLRGAIENAAFKVLMPVRLTEARKALYQRLMR